MHVCRYSCMSIFVLIVSVCLCVCMSVCLFVIAYCVLHVCTCIGQYMCVRMCPCELVLCVCSSSASDSSPSYGQFALLSFRVGFRAPMPLRM